MRNSVNYIIALVITALASGCFGGSGMVKKELIMKTKRIGVLSVVMDRVGDNAKANVDARAAILISAKGVYEKNLNAMPNWQVVDSANFKDHPILEAMGNIPENPESESFLMKLANQDQLPLDNEAVFARAVISAMSMDAAKLESVKKEAVIESAKEIQRKIINYYGEKFQGVDGLPLIPYRLASGEGGGKYHLAAAQAIIRKNIKTLCKERNLDGIVVVHLNSAVETTGGFHLTTSGRTKGIIKVNPEIVLISSSGETVILIGSGNLDDLAPMDIGPPVYVGKPGTKSFRIDLKDPKNEVLDAYTALIDKTSKKLIRKIAKQINE